MAPVEFPNDGKATLTLGKRATLGKLSWFYVTLIVLFEFQKMQSNLFLGADFFCLLLEHFLNLKIKMLYDWHKPPKLLSHFLYFFGLIQRYKPK